VVFALSSIVPLALQVFGGWISDSIGRMRAMILGTAAGVIESVVLALAPSWYWTILALSLGGIATSLVRPSQAAFLAEQSDEEKRGWVFGVFQTSAQIVRVVGPPVGGILAGRYGFRSVFLIGGCLYAAASVLLFRLVRATPAHAKVASGRLAWRSLRGSLSMITGIVTAGGLLTWIFIADGVTDSAFRLSGSLQSLYLNEVGGLGVEQIGWLMSISGSVTMVASLPAGWISDRWGEHVGISVGYLAVSIYYLIFIWAQSFSIFAIAILFHGLAHAVAGPSYASLISKAVPDERRGITFGLLWTSLGVTSLPAPWIGAQLWERFGPMWPFFVTAVAELVMSTLAWYKLRQPAKSSEGTSQKTGLHG
jgi:MFS family permease